MRVRLVVLVVAAVVALPSVTLCQSLNQGTRTALFAPITIGTTTGGTTGSVIFADADSLAEDNANLFWDDANNRLGIGTASPLDILHLVSTATFPFLDRINDGAGGGVLTFRKARGTIGGETAVLSGDTLGTFLFRGYHSGGAYPTTGNASVAAAAEEGFTSTAQGSRLVFNTTSIGSTSIAERVRINNVGNTGFGVTAPTAVVHLKAGTATANTAPQKIDAGTNLTTAEAGVVNEFDGVGFYDTHDTTSGRAQRADTHIFRYAANGSALGAAIADFYGATSAFPMAANGVYELTFYAYYLKTTAGTVTWTITLSGAVTGWIGSYNQTAVTGIGSEAAGLSAGLVTQTGTAAFPASGTNRSTAANHRAIIHVLVECGVTPRDIRLRVTSSAGTVTPLRGSYYTARRLAAGNVGTFAS